ncbi:acyl-CoA dehydrogenase family protein [Pseudonocardia ailaonensis]|uniref:Acyl-CoA dehydrogenase family protein n=1 Tax=Pseudonocardia ailaonensis TaxID=367279 RepID=A0ABN2NDS3_9PSEU
MPVTRRPGSAGQAPLPGFPYELQKEATEFAQTWVEQHGGYDDCWMVGHSRDAALAVAERGWIGMTWPEAVGGGGRSALEHFAVLEALIEAGVPIADWWFADQTVGPVLAEYGSPEQRDRWLTDIVHGRTRWTLGSAERAAGSDPTLMTTTARPDGPEHLRISGEKMWVQWPADWCYVICRIEAGGDSAATPTMGEFLVDLASEGVGWEPLRDSSGSESFGVLHLDNVRIPRSQQIDPGASRIRLLQVLDAERGGIDRLVSNRAAFVDAVRRLDPDDSTGREWAERLELEYRVARLMVVRSSVAPPYSGYGSLSKIFCSEYSQRVAKFVARAAGAAGLLEARPIRAQLSAGAYTVMGGTSQVLRAVAARRVLGLPSSL